MESNSGGHTSTIFNKIIIPVITTVLGATAIYFLGFNKKTSDPEKATVNAWQTFVAGQNINYKNLNSLNDEFKEKIATEVKEEGIKGMAPVLREYRDEVFKITAKGREDVETILKKDDVDEAFVTMMKRFLANSKDEEEKLRDFFDDLIVLTKANLTDEEKATSFGQKAKKIEMMAKRSDERAANEAEEIAQTLSKKYNRPFDLNELLVYVEYKKGKGIQDPEVKTKTPGKVELAPVDPTSGTEYKEKPQDDNRPVSANNPDNETEPTASLLTGEWQMKGGALELSKNGDMFWTIDNKGYTYGDWKLVAGKLQMHGTNPDTKITSAMLGFISDFTSSSFTLTLMSTPKEVYYFKRNK